jgi:uroporphyrinogen-III synthase
MIPKVLPPLTDLTVLVTRPAVQGRSLCAQIEQCGGTAIAFPAIEIEPVAAEPPANPDGYDLVLFLSVHAVMHGAHLVSLEPPTRVGAIGKATEAALTERGHTVHLVPESGFTSESLLAHPELSSSPVQRVLLVRGEGGRTLLRDFFVERGATVDTLEVYRRVRPALDEALREQVEARWAEDGIDVVTATSVETLTNLIELLSERGRNFLRSTPLLVPSGRIADAARSAGLQGEIILARGPDDSSMVGALANWHTRARTL